MARLDVPARTTCRACHGSILHFICSLGEQYVSNFVEADEGMALPLDIVLCDPHQGGCGLLQLRHTVPAELLYRQYWYRSVINSMMRAALAEITRKAEALVALSPGDLVLDIGCNDGTLLRSYQTNGLRRVGYEPAMNLIAAAQVETHMIFNEFFHARPFVTRFGNEQAKIVTTIAMFYDLDDPNAFVADLAACLHPEGVWVNQMSYLPSMLSQNAFDNICHEHLTYYSLATLSRVVNCHGLEIVDVELNDVNGGSFRTYIRHRRRMAACTPRDRLEALERREASLQLQSRRVYEEFARRVHEIRTQLTTFIQGEVAQGRTVYVYGASTKGNTLLQFCQLDHRLITAAAERNPDKWGKKTVGTLIPIISEGQARSERPDYFLVLPWHFLEEFVQREQAFLESGGQFIVPLPSVKIVSQRAAVPVGHAPS